ncbi:MAG: CRISPR-associated endonuclease Cas2 [Anaerolineae bacterium]|nr:CRISPR-associated endonuclease Cas2 [Anaerolineae bacterium]
MHILLVYDIVKDRQRAKVATVCLDYGLDRIQYSAFAGQLSRTHQEEIMMRIEAIVGESPASVHLYPIDEKAWQRRLRIENEVAALLERPSLEEDDDVPRSADE